MSADERDEILTHLRSLKALLNWLGGGLVVGMFGVAFVIAQDHFDQKHLRDSVDKMEPRVDQLWYEREFQKRP